jgi:hypothetical protein
MKISEKSSLNGCGHLKPVQTRKTKKSFLSRPKFDREKIGFIEQGL